MGMASLASALGRSAMVVKEVSVKDEGNLRVRIVARKAGLVSFVLTALGIDTTTTFELFTDRLMFSEGSIFGQMKTCMPLSALSVATGGFFKPLMDLIIGIGLAIAGIGTFLPGGGPFSVLLMLFGVAFIVWYFLSKSLLISVVSNSGWVGAICFKRCVIEGVNVDYSTALKVIDVMNELVMMQTSKCTVPSLQSSLTSSGDDKIWYLWDGEKQTGPFSTVAMEKSIAQGKLKPDRQVFREGFEDWKKLGETELWVRRPVSSLQSS